MWKLSAKWAPKCLKAVPKRQRCQLSEQILEFFRRDPNYFLSRLVAMKETLLYHYDPETKEQSMEWRHSSSPHPQKFRVQKSTGKFSSRFFGIKTACSHWLSSEGLNYQRLVLLISAGAIEGHFEGKTPRENHQGSLVLARNAPAHRPLATQTKLLSGLPLSWSPTYSPDMAPSDYLLFLRLKKQLICRNFSSVAEVIVAAETWFDGKILIFLWVVCKR